MRAKEEQSSLWWFNFLEELEDSTTSKITLEDILVFATGADKIPPCGFHKDIEIHFYEAYESDSGSAHANTCRVPYASTCSMVLYLPVGIESFSKFKEMLLRSLEEYAWRSREASDLMQRLQAKVDRLSKRPKVFRVRGDNSNRGRPSATTTWAVRRVASTPTKSPGTSRNASTPTSSQVPSRYVKQP
ncbi:hypothetical protein AC249_AIPGENE15212 [Exaiptasia diaphana]|nr:hypothetical protein AC249_AIPGENE15212 [Exaiptasia diaphana]